MARPYAMLRAGFPYVKTVGMRRLSVNFPVDVAIGRNDALYILCRNEEGVMVRMLTQDDDDLGSFGSLGTGDGQMRWPAAIICDGDGNLFVSDEACHRISRFSAEGEFLGKWGEFGADDREAKRPFRDCLRQQREYLRSRRVESPGPEVHQGRRVSGDVGPFRHGRW